MNYEKFKRSDRPDRFHSQFDITVNDFLSVVGEKFFNDYLRIYTKRFPISVKWNSYMLYDVHFAADWMNKFPNRGRGYQIANIISWQNSLHCSQLSTSSVIFNNFNN